MAGRFQRPVFVLVAVTVLVAACSSIQGDRLIDSARGPGARYFVEHQPRDGRRLDYQIASALEARGLTVTASREEADYVVTYEDRWTWDMRMYLRDLTIKARDVHTGAIVGTGRSRQDSLAALGKSHRDIVDRAVGAMFEGAPGRK